MKVLILITLFMALASSLPADPKGGGSKGGSGDDEDVPPNYNFAYEVKDPPSSVDFEQKEERNGDNTSGSYTVHLPDGRVMTVKYTVDKDGFHPEVTFEGEAQYPPQQENKQQSKNPQQPKPQPKPKQPKPQG